MKRLFAVLALLLLAQPVGAQDYDVGRDAYERGDYAAALEQWRPLAERGDPAAQASLGAMYGNGHGVPLDYAQAMKWYRKAADQGFGTAASNIGLMYYHGQGVPQDHAQALQWFRKAADQGDAPGQLLLGVMYELGQVVPQDFAAAAMWYRKAAQQNLAKAQLNLGFMYQNGRGVARDDAAALRWYRQAAAQGDAMALANVGAYYETGLGVEKDDVQALLHYDLAVRRGLEEAAESRDALVGRLAPERVAEAMGLADAWRATVTVERASQRPGNEQRAVSVREVQRLLNELDYDAGPVDGLVGPRTRAAIRAFQRSRNLPATGAASAELVARLNESIAAKTGAAGSAADVSKPAKAEPPRVARAATECDRLAAHTADRLRPAGTAGVAFEDIDPSPAIAACRRALASAPEDPRYQFQLARSLHKAERYAEAAAYYERAASAGSTLAQRSLGFMYADGIGVTKNVAKAVQWHRRAAEGGDADAQNNLGYLYADGRGVRQDLVEAHVWYSLAAAQGNEQAGKNRAFLETRMSRAQIAEAERLARERLEQLNR